MYNSDSLQKINWNLLVSNVQYYADMLQIALIMFAFFVHGDS